MAANINDKFSEVSTSVRPTTTTAASVRSVSGSSLVCDDLTGWATNTAVHFVTYELDGQGNVVPGTQQDMKGIVSGNTIGSIVITGGTDIGNKVGDVVQQLPTAAWAKDLADGISVMHNQDGTHKISDLPELATAAADDVLEITDVSAGTSNKVQAQNLAAAVVSGLADNSITPAKRSGGFAAGAFTRTTTGSYSVTGLGFKPKMVKFRYLGASSTNIIRWGEGVMTASSQSAGSIAYASTTFGMNASTSACIMRVSNGSSTPDILASFVSMDSGGFTINFTSNTSNGLPEWAWEAYA